MKLVTLFTTLAILLGLSAAGYNDRMGNGAYYDLGISLSSGYATISADLLPVSSRGVSMQSTKFPVQKNPRTSMTTHHFIDIAKIEGGEAYKTYMLGLEKESATVMVPRFCPFSSQACEFWPIKTSQTMNPLAPILQSLILAAESTLEAKVRSVAVTVYDLKTVEFSTMKQHIKSALEKIGVESHEFLDNSVPSVIKALGIPDRSCSPGQYTPSGDPSFRKHPEQVVISVDYTRESLTSSLWKVECGVIEQQGRKHASDGYDIVHRAKTSFNNTLQMENKLKSHFSDVCGNTRRRHREDPNATLSEEKGIGFVLDYESLGGKAVQERIDAVLLMGEKAGDEKMQALLRGVLAEQFSNGESVDLSQAQDLSPDLTFVGSRGVAWNEMKIQQDLDWERKMEICDRNYPHVCRL